MLSSEFKRPIVEVLSSITTDELIYWQVVYGEELLGEDRKDLQAGVIAAAVANYAGKCLKEDVYKTPVEFMPFADREAEEVSVPDSLNMIFGGMVAKIKEEQKQTAKDKRKNNRKKRKGK